MLLRAGRVQAGALQQRVAPAVLGQRSPSSTRSAAQPSQSLRPDTPRQAPAIPHAQLGGRRGQLGCSSQKLRSPVSHSVHRVTRLGGKRERRLHHPAAGTPWLCPGPAGDGAPGWADAGRNEAAVPNPSALETLPAWQGDGRLPLCRKESRQSTFRAFSGLSGPLNAQAGLPSRSIAPLQLSARSASQHHRWPGAGWQAGRQAVRAPGGCACAWPDPGAAQCGRDPAGEQVNACLRRWEGPGLQGRRPGPAAGCAREPAAAMAVLRPHMPPRLNVSSGAGHSARPADGTQAQARTAAVAIPSLAADGSILLCGVPPAGAGCAAAATGPAARQEALRHESWGHRTRNNSPGPAH